MRSLEWGKSYMEGSKEVLAPKYRADIHSQDITPPDAAQAASGHGDVVLGGVPAQASPL